jgi:hypothetical protein
MQSPSHVYAQDANADDSHNAYTPSRSRELFALEHGYFFKWSGQLKHLTLKPEICDLSRDQ